jgi:lysophospholipase L1-like esterase
VRLQRGSTIGRRLALVALCVLAAVLAAELASRLILRGDGDSGTLGLQRAVERLRQEGLRRRVPKTFQQRTGIAAGRDEVATLMRGLTRAMYEPAQETLLNGYRQRFAATLAELIDEIRRADAVPLLLYLPTFYPNDPALMRAQESERQILLSLAAELGVSTLDLSDQLTALGAAAATLLPKDGHLSPRANRVVARHLRPWLLKQIGDHRSRVSYHQRPAQLGDAPVAANRVVRWKKNLPFRLVTNSQGLRRRQDLEFPKSRPRLLILGDSFSFGPHIDTEDSYPCQLEELLGDGQWQVANAAWPGYTVLDHLSLFRERARFVEPDGVVVQLLFNDVVGMCGLLQRVFSRDWQQAQIDPRERALAESLLAAPAAASPGTDDAGVAGAGS